MTSITEIRSWRFALVGTPNSGKTALFNALTGSRQKVANYPGVTVERKTGTFQTSSGHRIDLFDLPGTYSLRGRSPDEEVTRDMVLGRIKSEAQPDLLLCVADATNLRAALRKADRVNKAANNEPARPDTLTGRIDAVLLHPVAGLVILLAVLFVMFQGVFAWAQPVMDLISGGFDALGTIVHDMLPIVLLQCFIEKVVIAVVGS